jgi:hypothetical protein
MNIAVAGGVPKKLPVDIGLFAQNLYYWNRGTVAGVLRDFYRCYQDEE